MAIYSCNLKSIGRTTHEAGTAGAHIRYISRPEAEPQILFHHMPFEAVEARTWMDGQERLIRKNARVLDKLRIALPRELTDAQRADLVAGFMGELTDGRIAWFAAIHQRGKDELNPHVHIAIHDRDIETGKRVLRLSDSARDRIKAGLPGPKAVEWIRERWEDSCNRALKAAGLEARVNRRTLEAQGIDRAPTIHEGPRAQHIDENVGRPKSRERINGCGRVIDYPSIDRGRTRREFNAHIIDLNLERASLSPKPATSIWALFEKRQAAARCGAGKAPCRGAPPAHGGGEDDLADLPRANPPAAGRGGSQTPRGSDCHPGITLMRSRRSKCFNSLSTSRRIFALPNNVARSKA
jgi:MobA/MobL family